MVGEKTFHQWPDIFLPRISGAILAQKPKRGGKGGGGNLFWGGTFFNPGFPIREAGPKIFFKLNEGEIFGARGGPKKSFF